MYYDLHRGLKPTDVDGIDRSDEQGCDVKLMQVRKVVFFFPTASFATSPPRLEAL